MDASLLTTLALAGLLAAALTASLVSRPTAGSWPAHVLRWVETFVSMLIVTAAVFAAALQIFARHYFSTSFDFSWTEELSRLLLVWMTYWAAVAVHRDNEHLSVPVLYDRLPWQAQRVLSIAVEFIVLIILVLVAKEGFESAWLQLGQKTITLDLPVAIFAVAVPLGCLLMAIHTIVSGVCALTRRSG